MLRESLEGAESPYGRVGKKALLIARRWVGQLLRWNHRSAFVVNAYAHFKSGLR